MSLKRSVPAAAEAATIIMNKTRFLVYAAVTAALYAVLTLAFSALSYGPVQLRISELLTVLPIFAPFAMPGLTVGCIVANLIGGYGIYDILIGSLATFLGAVGTRLLRKRPVPAMLSPVVSNALLVGSMLYFVVPDSPTLLLNIVTVGVGELIICMGLGLPLVHFLKKRPELFPGSFQ